MGLNIKDSIKGSRLEINKYTNKGVNFVLVVFSSLKQLRLRGRGSFTDLSHV